MTGRTRIHLIRHGEVEGAETRRYNGHGDVGLSPRGIAQYEALKARFDDLTIAACYSSDLKRCVVGAEMLGAHLGVTQVLNRDLRELHIGIWERMSWAEIIEKYPVEWQARLDDIVNYRVPDGESLQDLHDRVMPVLHDVVRRHVGEEVLMVAHGGVNRVILLDAMGAPLTSFFNIEQQYCGCNIIDYYTDGNAVVNLLNG